MGDVDGVGREDGEDVWVVSVLHPYSANLPRYQTGRGLFIVSVSHVGQHPSPAYLERTATVGEDAIPSSLYN